MTCVGACVCHPPNGMKSEITIHPRITGGCWWTGGSPPIQHPPGGGSYTNSIVVIHDQQTRYAAMQSQSLVCCVSHSCFAVLTPHGVS